MTTSKVRMMSHTTQANNIRSLNMSVSCTPVGNGVHLQQRRRLQCKLGTHKISSTHSAMERVTAGK